MNNSIIYFGLILTFFICSKGFSEDPTHAIPQTGSHRAFAMGSTYIAFDTGINALYGNPAGLAKSRTAEIFIGHYLQVHKTMQFEDAYYATYFNSSSISYKTIQRFNYIGISFLKATSDSLIRFGGAIGFSSFYNWRSTKHQTQLYPMNEKSRIEKNFYGLYDLFHIGIGLSAGNMGTIGITVNLPFMKNAKTETHDRYETAEGNIFIDHYSYYRQVEAKPFIRIGLMTQVTSQISLGILWNQSYWYKYEYQKRVFPSTLNFGVAIKPIHNLLVALDIESRPWTKVKIQDEYLTSAQSGTAWHFGVEYGGKLKGRAGYTWDILPVLDTEGQAVDLQSLTLGIGYKVGTVIIDLGVRHRYSTYSVKDSMWWRDDNNIYDYYIRDWVIQSGIKFVHRI